MLEQFKSMMGTISAVVLVVGILSQTLIYFGNAIYTRMPADRSFHGLSSYYLCKPVIGAVAAAVFVIIATRSRPSVEFIVLVVVGVSLIVYVLTIANLGLTKEQKIIALLAGFFVGLGEICVCFVVARDPMVLTMLLPTGPIWFTIWVFVLNRGSRPTWWDVVAVILVVLAMVALAKGRLDGGKPVGDTAVAEAEDTS
jgi:hypothetical protein